MDGGKPCGAGAGAAAALIGLALFLPGIGSRGFWAPDEPRFGQVANEMLGSGDYVVPRMNGEPVALLPPLTYWASALASRFFGELTPVTARIPIVLAAALTLAATALLGRAVSPPAGLWSAAVLGTTALFVHQATWLQADIYLAASTAWALFFFYRGYVAPERRASSFFASWIALAPGALAKGPLAAALFGIVVFVFLCVRRDLRLLRSGAFWAGLPLLLALVVPWYALACMREGPRFAHVLLVKYTLGMFFDSWSHKQPAYYHVLNFPWTFLPWTALLPASALYLVRRRVRAEQRCSGTFLACWAIALFGFFTIGSAKQQKYLLPAFPPVAVAVGLLIANCSAFLDRAVRRLALGGLLIAGFAIALAGAAFLGAAALRISGTLSLPAKLAPYEAPLRAAIPLAAVALAGGALVSVLSRRGQDLRRAAAALAAVCCAVALIVETGLFAAIDPFKTPRALCEAARVELRRARVSEPAPERAPRLGIYGISFEEIGNYIYLTGERLVRFEPEEGRYDAAAFEAFLRDPRPSLAFITAPALGAFPLSAYREIARQRVGRRSVVLIAGAGP